MKGALEPTQMLNSGSMSMEDWLGRWKITTPLLPIRKHSRTAPEPLGWRKYPWPFLPLGHSGEESAMMVMFSCKPAGSLLGCAQAGAYVNIFPFQTCILCSSLVQCLPFQAGTWGLLQSFPPLFFLCPIYHHTQAHLCPHSQSRLLRFDSPPSFLLSPATCWGWGDHFFVVVIARTSFMHR